MSTNTFKENSGTRKNNMDKGLALRELLKIAIKAYIKYFQVFGDFTLWIDYMNGGDFFLTLIFKGFESISNI